MSGSLSPGFAASKPHVMLVITGCLSSRCLYAVPGVPPGDRTRVLIKQTGRPTALGQVRRPVCMTSGSRGGDITPGLPLAGAASRQALSRCPCAALSACARSAASVIAPVCPVPGTGMIRSLSAAAPVSPKTATGRTSGDVPASPAAVLTCPARPGLDLAGPRTQPLSPPGSLPGSSPASRNRSSVLKQRALPLGPFHRALWARLCRSNSTSGPWRLGRREVITD